MRRKIPEKIRVAVLTEAGFRCAVPTCRAILAIDLHHIVPVSETGPDTVTNLLALCPTCHALYHRGVIPHESICVWKRALVATPPSSAQPLATSDQPSPTRLRVLYFHEQPRSSGLDHIHCRSLANELTRRLHDIRFCWAVYPPLANDPVGASKDIVSPASVVEWQPHALVFESGLFIGLPRMPLDLLDEFEANGTVVLIAIPPHEYESQRAEYDSFFDVRGIEVPSSDREEPRCRADMNGGEVVFSSTQIQKCSVADTAVLTDVSLVHLGSARPFRSLLPPLLVGQENIFVKAYHNPDIHGVTYPTLGVLNDKRHRTEAIFMADIAIDHDPPSDNSVYLANLLEWLFQRRYHAQRCSAESFRA